MIQENEVAFLKTTGEAVFVLGIDTIMTPHSVRVRRAKMSRDGIEHLTEYFYLAELESLENQKARFVAEREEVLKKYGPQANQQSAAQDDGFGIN